MPQLRDFQRLTHKLFLQLSHVRLLTKANCSWSLQVTKFCSALVSVLVFSRVEVVFCKLI
jgi:hypothetical protein